MVKEVKIIKGGEDNWVKVAKTTYQHDEPNLVKVVDAIWWKW